jgi:hypothetical protein
MYKLNIPGFTAEASLRKTRQLHREAGTFEARRSNNRMQPQVRRPTGPYGPIGLPGQDCAGACAHVCMSFGSWSFDRCLQDCLRTCSGPSWSASVMTHI